MAGSFNFTLRASNESGEVITGSISIVITDAAPSYDGSLDGQNYTFIEDTQIEPINLAAAFKGESLTYALATGSLPPGLSFDSATGVISGTATD